MLPPRGPMTEMLSRQLVCLLQTQCSAAPTLEFKFTPISVPPPPPASESSIRVRHQSPASEFGIRAYSKPAAFSSCCSGTRVQTLVRTSFRFEEEVASFLCLSGLWPFIQPTLSQVCEDRTLFGNLIETKVGLCCFWLQC